MAIQIPLKVDYFNDVKGPQGARSKHQYHLFEAENFRRVRNVDDM